MFNIFNIITLEWTGNASLQLLSEAIVVCFLLLLLLVNKYLAINKWTYVFVLLVGESGRAECVAQLLDVVLCAFGEVLEAKTEVA